MPSPPLLRTVRTRFRVHGSQVEYDVPGAPEARAEALPYSDDARSPSCIWVRFHSLVDLLRSLPHVCTLSGWSYDLSGGLCFPVPFGCRPSLLGASCPRWGVVPPSRLAYWSPRPHRDYHVPHIQPDTVGSVYPPVVRHLRQTTPKRLVLTTYLLVWACQPLAPIAFDEGSDDGSLALAIASIPRPDRRAAGSRRLCSRYSDHRSEGLCVPAASHPIVTNDACAGRELLAEQQVASRSATVG